MKLPIDTKPTLWDGLVILGVVVLTVACALSVWGGSTTRGLTAVLSVDGAVTERVALTDIAPQERTITAHGYTLHLQLTEEAVWMETADCPTQDCVHTGRISRSGQSVVCLPARFSVQLTGETADGVDAVLG
ncbi:MAG: NusG domain II-containing protein [Oscillibacter sp.]